LQQLHKKGLAYVHIMSGLTFGFHKKCDAITMAMARKVYPGPLICNVGYDRDTADAEIASGNADAVSFGRPYIANPDLVYRWAHDLPLAEADYTTWFSHDAKGYADYPTYLEAQAVDE